MNRRAALALAVAPPTKTSTRLTSPMDSIWASPLYSLMRSLRAMCQGTPRHKSCDVCLMARRIRLGG